jgi:WD40 repeat protein
VFDLPTGKPKWEQKGHEMHVDALAFSADSVLLASGDVSAGRDWAAETGDPMEKYTLVFLTTALSFSPDRRTLASGGFNGIRMLPIGGEGK